MGTYLKRGVTLGKIGTYPAPGDIVRITCLCGRFSKTDSVACGIGNVGCRSREYREPGGSPYAADGKGEPDKVVKKPLKRERRYWFL